MNPKWYTLMILLAMTVTCIAPVTAEAQAPQIPHVFFGIASAGDQPVPAGTVIEARGAGITTGIRGNPVTTTTDGKYGGAGSFDPKLIVQGTVQDGTPVEFYIAGVRAEYFDVTANSGWQQSLAYKTAGYTQLNLRIAAVPATATVTPTATSPQGTTTPTSLYTYSSSGGGGGGSGGGGVYNAPVSAATGVRVTTNVTAPPTTKTTGNATRSETTVLPPITSPEPGAPAEMPAATPKTPAPINASGLFPSMNLMSMEAASVLGILAGVGILVMRGKRDL